MGITPHLRLVANEGCLGLGISDPPGEKIQKRLHSLPAEDAERWRDDADTDGRWLHILAWNECAPVSC